MYQIPLATSSTLVTRQHFWDCVKIYHDRPHLVNRKILATKQILFYAVHFCGCSKITNVLNCHSLAYEVRKIKDINSDNITLELLENLLKVYDKDVKFNKCNIDDLGEIDQGIFLSVRIVLPRTKNTDKCVELVAIDKNKDELTFFSASLEADKMIPIPTFSYQIELTNNGFLRINVNDFEDADTGSAQWLQDSLFSKIMKWITDPTENIGLPSLSCVSVEKYCNLYSELKNMYGEPLRKVWKEKTKTDPQKFIFEDIAIASYLICIWDNIHDNAKDHVRFVDCGCGNGLLVYLLNKAGYEGYGIDIRKRNIWDLFSDSSILKFKSAFLIFLRGIEHYVQNQLEPDIACFETTPSPLSFREIEHHVDLVFFPSEACELLDIVLYPSEVGAVEPKSRYSTSTWLIGNHSDELTPWLPVIALRSSSDTNFFVLPCCPFDLDGNKYIRKNTALSQYADYLDHIRNISEMCKFEVLVDKLRIPSTKRTCLIGIQKTKNEEEIAEACIAINDFIFSKFGGDKQIFKPRSSIEKVRNCTQIGKNVIFQIVKNVVYILLVKEVCLIKGDGSQWNIGGSEHLADLSKKLTCDDLSHLKKECGGLQTLIRNHRYLFKIDNAHVSLRKPYTIEETSKYKHKPCWYHQHHPNGCLYDSEICGYNHCIK